MKPYIFNLFNGLVLLIIGFWIRFLGFEYALIFIVLGSFILMLSYFVKKSHMLLGSIAMTATNLTTVAMVFLFFGSFQEGLLLQAPFGMMLISGVASSTAFIHFGLNHDSQPQECCTSTSEGLSYCNIANTKATRANVGCC